MAPLQALPVTLPPPGSACGGGSAALAGAESPCAWLSCTGSVTSDYYWLGLPSLAAFAGRQKALELTTVGDSQ